jgi:hypothetical protein
MAGRPDVRVVGNTLYIEGVPPITIQDKEKWQSMNLVERSDAIQEIYNAVKPRRSGRAALQGATFGLSDEAIAAAQNPMAAISAAIGGESEKSAPYYEALQSERGKLEQYRQQFPIEAAVSEIGGAAIPAVAGAIVSGGSSAPATGTRLAQIVKGGGRAAGIGALEGGLYGFGSAEGGMVDRLKGTAAGATLGAVFSPVAQAATYPIAVGASFLVDTAKNVFGPRGGKAVQAELQRLAEGTGETVDVIAQRVANGEIMAENETLRSTVRYLMSRGGVGERMVRTTFDAKMGRPKIKREEAMAQIESYLARDPQFAGQNPKQIQADFDAQVKKAETEAYQGIPNYKAPADADIATAIQNSVTQFPNIAEELNTYVTSFSKGSKLIEKKDGKFILSRQPTLEEAEAARRYFRDKAEELRRSGNPLGSRYREVRYELEALVNDQSSDLTRVRADAKQVRTARDAYDYGLDILNQSSDDVDMYLRDILDNEAAMKSLRAGALANIRKKVEQAGGTNLMNKLQNAETREGKVFRAIFPPDKFEETMSIIERAAQSQSAFGDIIKGPSTALTQEAGKQSGSAITAEDLSNIANPVTAMRVGAKVIQELAPDLSDKQRTQVLEVLLSEDPDVVRRALTDSRGMEMLQSNIFRIRDMLRAGVRGATTQQSVSQGADPSLQYLGLTP